MTTENVLKRCQEAFKASGMTLDALTEKSGLARTTVNSYLHNPPKRLRDTTVKLLAAGLGIDASQLPESDEPESAPEIFMIQHCTACRAETAKHNEALREDFKQRFTAMKDAYEDRISHINDKFTQRIADQKERYDERHALVLEHHAERVDKLNETIVALQADNARLHKRNRVLIITLIILAAAVGILSVIDLSHEGIGWLPHILRLSTGAH